MRTPTPAEICNSIYTLEDMKAWKSFDADNLLKSGWIGDVAVSVLVNDGYHVIWVNVGIKHINGRLMLAEQVSMTLYMLTSYISALPSPLILSDAYPAPKLCLLLSIPRKTPTNVKGNKITNVSGLDSQVNIHMRRSHRHIDESLSLWETAMTVYNVAGSGFKPRQESIEVSMLFAILPALTTWYKIKKFQNFFIF